MNHPANNGLQPLAATLWEAVTGGGSAPIANLPVANATIPGYPPPPPK